MQKIYKFILPVLIGLMPFTSVFSQYKRCGTQEAIELAFKQNPSLKVQMEMNEKKLGEAITKTLAQRQTSPNNSSFAPAVTIPIVFHVVLTAAQQAQVTDAMILAQLNILNQDFTGFNADSSNVPPAFQSVRGHGTFSFCMAQRTPAGLATNGINRVVSTTRSNSSTTNDPIKSTAAGGSDVWDPTKYVNVWLTNFTNANLLGYASFPIGSQENTSGNISQQGVVVLAQSIPGGTATPYNFGRTLTHELGHFFWLRHIWGDGTCGNDFPNTPGIDDTPDQSNSTFNCPGTAPTVSALAAGCATTTNPPGRMFQNFMDYTDDACMTMFTIGQQIRAEQAINTFRASLLTSNGCQALSGFNFNNTSASSSVCSGPTSAAVSLNTTAEGGFSTPIILSASGVPTGATISFSVNPLTPGNATTVTLNNVNVLAAGTYNITVTGIAGAVTKNTTLVFIVQAGAGPSITTQPAAQAVCVGADVTFALSATGATNYQWQVNTGSGFTNISGANSSSYTITGTTGSQNGYIYQVIASTQCGSTTSTTALLNVTTAAAITTQPASTSACTGGTASFTSVASGTSLTYVWEVSSDGGLTWATVPSATGATLNLSALTSAENGNLYRVKISNSCATATSNAATLTVNNTASILSQPTAQNVCSGSSTSFMVSAAGTGLGYQWQISTDGGTTWNNIAGANAATYAIASVPQSANNNRYRVLVTSTCSATGTLSDAVLLTVFTPVTVDVAPPREIRGCVGDDITLTVVATGSGLSYQWNESVNGGTSYSAIPGATSSSYTITNLARRYDGYLYTVTITGVPCGLVTTLPTLVRANFKPGVVLAPARPNTAITPSSNTTLYATVSPVAPATGSFVYSWTLNNQPISATGSSVYVTPDALGTYSVTVTDTSTGCSNTSNAVTITDAVSNAVFIYPNPNVGRFQVRYYGPVNGQTVRTVNVYDAKGARVLTKTYSIARTYEGMDVDMRNMNTGIYMVELKDTNGKRLASASVIVK